MEIKVLGCSGGIGPGLRTTSLLIGGDVLVDAGTGVGDLTLEQMTGVRHALLTHCHLDHVCGLAFIVDNLFGVAEQALAVHAIPETLTVLREHVFNNQLWPDFTRLRCDDREVLSLQPLAIGQPLRIGELVFTAFKVDHTVPAVGYVIEGCGAVCAFTGDTGVSESLWQALNALKRLDHLLIEVAFPDENEQLSRVAKHFTPALLGAELAKLRHRPLLHLTHAKPGVERLIERECATALKGWTYRHLRRGDTISLEFAAA